MRMMSPGEPFDSAAFGELVDRHHAALYAFVRRRVAEQAAIEDVLADTFLVAWRRRAEIPDPALPWLYGVCLRTISTHRRSGRRRLRLRGRLSSEPGATGRDPADVYAARSEINRAFAQLSDGERETLRLIAWDGLSTEDAARVLGVTAGTFRVRFHRARRALRKHLDAPGHEQVMTRPANGPQTESAG
jgi:RNA polymerase sigma-70 factor, ECF subfamily